MQLEMSRVKRVVTERVLAFLAIATLSTHVVVLAKEPDTVDAVGPLVIVGGAESSDGRVLQRVVQMAGGENARLVIVPIASQEQQAAIDHYERAFREFGVQNIRSLIINSRDDAFDGARIAAITQATGVFFSGGDQSRVVKFLQDTPLAEALLERNKNGMVLAGTSAGAAMMSRQMILEGPSNSVPALGIVDTGAGMTLIRGVLIDQHFSQRGRQGRLLSALADRPQTLGVGIDENTALVVENGEFRVVGAAAVNIYDVSTAKYSIRKSAGKGELALVDGGLHVIPGGFKFHFEGRKPIITGDPYPSAE